MDPAMSSDMCVLECDDQVKGALHANTTDRYTWDYRSVAPSVVDMSYERLAYDDQDTADQMHDDCTACGSRIDLATRSIDSRAVTMPAPSLQFDHYPREVRKPEIEVSDAAAHLASRLHLHLD
jgi:hypothetical protein